ncbi:hypothetical protein A3B45_01875 [Candidatus Daviesbacteria bacterium RIFCSPLOWO2_01_FULL_39_12]|uniref:Type II secretion system protein GspG C-terminal domain-containing protein n=1 Tax=Candidatus Daviesbacteria bacterium RIFCSPLOWO2_01_FULL_39_12 TaxID=1797785 RepID=A0A1F5KM83_9BACT|nr:MAG: hypothetical protein A3D79_00970 [Candidatus Daviesbacteria bacterium RIFCSPHIGHO2_02_FULL_39_8]OGE41949.1 MAG: hypothetical protein A3B45_01875 [Candidatus Daviesbacteria bacterium RIFCSPLOWO2_01_FULL_39_12]
MHKLLPKSARNPRGFTLIELLVVISIIAILAVIGITIFSGAQARARNAKRRTDVNALVSALEVNKDSTASVYAVISGSWFSGGGIPQEGTGGVPQYALLYVSAQGYTVNSPTAWLPAAATPTSNNTNPAGGTVAVVSLACGTPPCGGPIPGAGTLIYSFSVCTLLESEVIGGGTRSIYCRQNSQ